jgi:hypothetical protein
MEASSNLLGGHKADCVHFILYGCFKLRQGCPAVQLSGLKDSESFLRTQCSVCAHVSRAYMGATMCPLRI